MKHIFILNPMAGKTDKTKEFEKEIVRLFENKNEPYEIIFTEYEGHGKVIAQSFQNTKEPVRLYAFGGDGTLNEVLCGAYGNDNLEIAIFPCGTGNDFAKVMGDIQWSVEKLIDGQVDYIDIIKVNNRLCANIANVGFDAKVAYNATRFKKCLGGHLAYYVSVFFSLLGRINMKVKVFVNEKEVYCGKSLLCAAANGNIYGGGFKVAPKALVTDGLLNFVVIFHVTKLKIANLISQYKDGNHAPLINQGLMNTYTGQTMKIESPKQLTICADGEVFKADSCEIEIIPKAIKCVFPKEYFTKKEPITIDEL